VRVVGLLKGRVTKTNPFVGVSSSDREGLETIYSNDRSIIAVVAQM
jgi:hypothetical protein